MNNKSVLLMEISCKCKCI